jgi:hypothetical protein
MLAGKWISLTGGWEKRDWVVGYPFRDSSGVLRFCANCIVVWVLFNTYI